MRPIARLSRSETSPYAGFDIKSRRGHVQGTEDRANARVIAAMVPLAQMFGYVTDLRSKTQGRGSYSMEPSHYEVLPPSLAAEITKKA